MIKQTRRKMAIITFTVLLILAVLPSTAQAASKLKLNKTKAAVYVGKTVTLKVSGASGTVKWISKNKKIATVKKMGGKSAKVTAKKAGKTTITAKIGKKSVKCSVTVSDPYLNVKSKTLSKKETFQLKLTGAKIRSCTSDSKKVATVSKAGRITAKKAGKAVISVNASNGKVYKCTVTVPFTAKELFDWAHSLDEEQMDALDEKSLTATGVVTYIGLDIHDLPSIRLSDSVAGRCYVHPCLRSKKEYDGIRVGDTVTVTGSFHIFSNEWGVVLKESRVHK